MTLDTDDIRFALSDASARQEALINLLYQTDQKALGFASLYYTLMLAMGSVAIAGLAGDTPIPVPLAIGLIVSAILFFVGGVFCLRAMTTQEIGFPSRGPDFWLWAIEHAPDFKSAAIHYLSDMEAKVRLNRENNCQSAKAMRWAKRFGLAAPVCGLLAAVAGIYCSTF